MEDEASEEDQEPKHTSKSNKPASMADCDDKWIATHAQQVTRMLTGGLDVVGIFALAPPNMMQSSQTKLRQILFSIHKSLSRGQLHAESPAERYLLQICSSTRKLTCRTVDVSDIKSAFRPADWKPHSVGENWIKLETDMNIDLKINVPVKQQNHTMLKQIQHGIAPYCANIRNGIISFNGEVRDVSEMLDQSESKRSKGRDKGQTTQQVYSVEFFTQPISTKTEEPQLYDSICKLVIQGVTHGRAFVHSKATVSEAKEAISTDIVRSIQARCELLCEDIEVVEEEGTKKELYDTPVRVFGKLPGSNIDFCDYKFQDEKLEEVTERIKELLDITIDPTDLELDSEQVASEEDWVQSKEKESSLDLSNSSSTKSKFNILTAVAGGMAVLAAGLSYMLFGNSET